MNFYRGRPLALAITICLLASAAVAFLSAVLKIIIMAAIVLGVSAYIFILRRKLGFIPRFAVTALLCSALTLACLLTSYVYLNVHTAKHASLNEGILRATVTDIRFETDYSSSYTVRLLEVDSKKYSGKGIIKSESLLSLETGDIIEANAVFTPLSEEFNYRSGSRLSAIADGYVFVCTVDNVSTVGSSNSIEVILTKLRNHTSASMSLYLDKETAAMSDALLLGIRDGLGVIKRYFSYMGVTHLLALSGLHIVILAGAADKTLAFFRIGKRIRMPLCALFIIGYVALTGFLLSAVRAALMVLLSYAATATAFKSDSITSLFTAVYLIILTSPTALWDVGLQMSFFATLGVILMSEAYTEHFKDKGKRLKRFAHYTSSIAASLGATLFVLPFQWLYFGEMAPMSVPATLVMSLICEAFLILCLPYAIFALFGLHFPAAVFAGTMTVVYRLCAATAELTAGISSIVSLRYPFTVPILVLLISAIAIMAAKNVKSWLYALIPFSAAALLFAGCIGIRSLVTHDRIVADYVNVGTHDGFCLIDRGHTAVIDFSDGSSSFTNQVINTLSDEYATSIDAYILTDVSTRRINALRSLMRHRVINTVAAPAAIDQNDVYLLRALKKVTEEYGAELVLYSREDDTRMEVGRVTLTLPRHTVLNRSVKPLPAARFEYGGKTLAYAGSSAWENELVWRFTDEADYIVIGAHGPSVRSKPSGTVSHLSRTVYCHPNMVDTLSDWLYGYDGKLYAASSAQIVISP